MDSITQAVLGAAVGEAVLGKNLRNRAILWGGIAGTIPDLDVLSRIFEPDPIYGLVYHRGLTHSILFTVLAPLLLGWLSHSYYKNGWEKKPPLQLLWAGIWGLVYLLSLVGLGFLAYQFPSGLSFSLLGAGLLGAYFFYHSLQKSRLLADNLLYQSSFKQWYLMYFLAILTHWFIDACTSYGTQIFEPFSSYRISFNNISIVDPLYTVPFLLFLPLAYWAQSWNWRRVWNGLALGLSSAYMVWTFAAKNEVNKVIEKNLKEQQIAYTNYTSSPLIFNTILWQTMVETDSSFYYGMYSLLDKEPKMVFRKLPKNHELIQPYAHDERVKIVLWFAQGFYNIEPDPEGGIKMHNLRFGLALTSVERDEYSYVMHYKIKSENGAVTVKESRQNPAELDLKTLLAAFWERLKGK